MVDEVQRMQNAAQQIDLREETEDEEVSNLAMMIKVTLTKVRTKRITSPLTSFFAYTQHVFRFTQRSNLRKALETAQELYKTANEETTK